MNIHFISIINLICIVFFPFISSDLLLEILVVSFVVFSETPAADL